MNPRPRSRALDALTPAECEVLARRAHEAGGWLPLNRLWPELSPTTMRRAARGENVTALVLSAVRARLRPGPVTAHPPDRARRGVG